MLLLTIQDSSCNKKKKKTKKYVQVPFFHASRVGVHIGNSWRFPHTLYLSRKSVKWLQVWGLYSWSCMEFSRWCLVIDTYMLVIYTISLKWHGLLRSNMRRDDKSMAYISSFVQVWMLLKVPILSTSVWVSLLIITWFFVLFCYKRACFFFERQSKHPDTSPFSYQKISF